MPGPALTAAIPGLIAAGGDILGGLIGGRGQAQTNAQNLAIAREQMRFQERMSSTAYQRSAADLEKAGLNRILALGKPASSPAGAQQTMQNPKAAVGQGVASAAHSALAIRRATQEIKNLMAQEQLTIAQKQAIQPAATTGGMLEEIVTNTRRRGFEGIGKDIRDGYKTAKGVIGEIAKDLGLNQDKVVPLLIETLNKMDLPANVKTPGQKLTWAKQNPKKVQDFLARQKILRGK